MEGMGICLVSTVNKRMNKGSLYINHLQLTLPLFTLFTVTPTLYTIYTLYTLYTPVKPFTLKPFKESTSTFS